MRKIINCILFVAAGKNIVCKDNKYCMLLNDKSKYYRTTL